MDATKPAIVADKIATAAQRFDTAVTDNMAVERRMIEARQIAKAGAAALAPIKESGK